VDGAVSGVEYVPDPHRSLYAQRDDARDIAVALEQENAELRERATDLLSALHWDCPAHCTCAYSQMRALLEDTP
jgi:hypothetical protein